MSPDDLDVLLAFEHELAGCSDHATLTTLVFALCLLPSPPPWAVEDRDWMLSLTSEMSEIGRDWAALANDLEADARWEHVELDDPTWQGPADARVVARADAREGALRRLAAEIRAIDFDVLEDYAADLARNAHEDGFPALASLLVALCALPTPPPWAMADLDWANDVEFPIVFGYLCDGPEVLMALAVHRKLAGSAALAAALDRLTSSVASELRLRAMSPSALNTPFRGYRPRYQTVSLPDGRRGVFYRMSHDDRSIEVCAGRSGDDEYVRLAVGDELTEKQIRDLESTLSAGAWALEVQADNEHGERLRRRKLYIDACAWETAQTHGRGAAYWAGWPAFELPRGCDTGEVSK